jgi:hypothetical protein
VSTDEIFDPEIHAVDKDGNPSLNKDGSFRKKRKDAGGSRRGGGGRPRAASSAPKSGDPRGRYHRAVSDVLALPVAGLSMADPVLGFAGSQVAPLWADALADLAVEQPRLAAVLERASGVGAVGGLLGVGLLTFAQFGNLMGKVPDHLVRMVGGKTRGEIEQILQQRGEQLARQRPPAPAAEESPEHARAEAVMADAVG